MKVGQKWDRKTWHGPTAWRAHGAATKGQRESNMTEKPTALIITERRVKASPKRVTRAAVRAKCLDCLGGRKWDCGISTCPLYPWQPWPGRAMPSR
jgi:hypothetical protein